MNLAQTPEGELSSATPDIVQDGAVHLVFTPPPPPAPDNPLASLWQQISNAKWMADIGLPLTVTLIITVMTVLIAYFNLKEQLHQDRQLAQRDLNREWGRELAEDLRKLADRLRGIGAVGESSSHAHLIAFVDWRFRWMRIMHDFEKAVRRAQLRLGPSAALTDLDEFRYQIAQSWNVAMGAIEERPDVDLKVLSRAIGLMGVGRPSQLTGAAEVLENWVGDGDLPRLNEALLTVREAPRGDDYQNAPTADGDPELWATFEVWRAEEQTSAGRAIELCIQSAEGAQWAH